MKPGRKTRKSTLLGALGLAGLLMFLLTPSAEAADQDNQILLSDDGSHWGITLERPIFKTSPIFIPGSSATATMWVRNNASEPANLSIAAMQTGSESKFSQYLGLQVNAPHRSTKRVPLQMLNGCVEILKGWDMASGEAMRLDFVLDMDVQASNSAMEKTAELDVRFLLEADPELNDGDALPVGNVCNFRHGTVTPGLDRPSRTESASPVEAPNQAGTRLDRQDPGSHNFLADTGVRGIAVLIAAGKVILILGLVLVGIVRQRKQGNDD